MVKNYVLDTNVLIYDPLCIHNFEDNNVLIPFPVIEEIDKLKMRNDLVGSNARWINKLLADIFSKNDITMNKKLKLENGGHLKIITMETDKIKIPHYLGTSPDDKILVYAKHIKTTNKKPTILVTKDNNLKIKAQVLGIPVQDYTTDAVEDASLIENEIIHIKLKKKDEKLLENDNKILKFDKVEKYFTIDENGCIFYDDIELTENALIDFSDGNHFIFHKHKREFRKTVYYTDTFFNIQMRNVEQLYAMEALLDPDIPLVCLSGKSGTGKTLLSIAAGLYKTLEEQEYKKILVSKPVISVGNEIGFLPGDADTKMSSWIQPMFDNLELLYEGKGKDPKEYLIKKGILAIEVISFIRGRSIPNQYMIIDEVQNLTPHEIKTIITRIGEGTKLVLIGDPEQIDNPRLNRYSNGLVYVINKFKNNKLMCHIHLTHGERSELASIASEIL